MKKIIYVDSENIGSSFFDKINQLDENWYFVICYTDKSTKIPIKNLIDIKNSKCNFSIFETNNGTENALDFALCAILGQHCYQYKDDIHIVYSNDLGYTAAINVLRNIGYKVYRIGSVIDNGENDLLKNEQEEADFILKILKDEPTAGYLRDKEKRENLKMPVPMAVPVDREIVTKHPEAKILEAKIVTLNDVTEELPSMTDLSKSVKEMKLPNLNEKVLEKQYKNEIIPMNFLNDLADNMINSNIKTVDNIALEKSFKEKAKKAFLEVLLEFDVCVDKKKKIIDGRIAAIIEKNVNNNRVIWSPIRKYLITNINKFKGSKGSTTLKSFKEESEKKLKKYGLMYQ